MGDWVDDAKKYAGKNAVDKAPLSKWQDRGTGKPVKRGESQQNTDNQPGLKGSKKK